MWPFRRRLTANEVGGQYASGRRLVKVPWQHESLRGLPGGLPASEAAEALPDYYRGLDKRIEHLARRLNLLEAALLQAGVVHWQAEGFRAGPRERGVQEDGAPEVDGG